MVHHTLVALSQVQRLAQVWVLVHPQDNTFATHVPSFHGRVLPLGGATRAHTVLNGLRALRSEGVRDTDWVLVHDAARCLLQAPWVNALIDACQTDAVGGLLALPVADTLKTAHGGRVVGSVERADKWQAQTPQMFRLGHLQAALTQALSRSPESITDAMRHCWSPVRWKTLN
jgi:2-C-methyl-D-erythritol 4-phosphate cytidylyltransferase